MINFKNQKTIELSVSTITMGANYIIELFHANANRAESYAANHLNNQPGFVSLNLPAMTTEGILQIAVAGNARGTYGWINERMTGIDNAGLQSWEIASGKGVMFSYRAILNYLSSKVIKIGRVKITGNILALPKVWKYRKYLIDGSTYSEDIVLSNMIAPEQVQNNILVFDLNKEFDGGTALEIETLPGEALYIVFDYEEVK